MTYLDRDEYPSTYEQLLRAHRIIPILQVDEVDYSGDSFLVVIDRSPPERATWGEWYVYNGGKSEPIGFLQIGWGSCSGCDALEDVLSSGDPEELEKLFQDLKSRIKWFDTREDLQKWVAEHDWKGDWCADSPALKVFQVLVANGMKRDVHIAKKGEGR